MTSEHPVRTGLAASAASLAILAGSAAAAPAQTQDTYTQDLATTLSLPVGKTVGYFNRATNTALSERCEVDPDKSVSCRLDVYGITAGLVHRVKTNYAVDQEGRVTTQSTKASPQIWSSDSHMSVYQNIKANAQVAEWAAESPLARVAQNEGKQVIQNAIGERTPFGERGVAVCSVVPVSDKRGIDVCMAFDRATNEVRSSALPRLEVAGALNAALTQPQAAIRDFSDRRDSAYLKDHSAKLPSGGGPSYFMRSD